MRALGCGLGFLVTRSTVFLAPADLPRLDEVSFDWLAVLVTVLVTSLAGVVFGALPTAVLSLPRVLANSAVEPSAVLLEPVVFRRSAWSPTRTQVAVRSRRPSRSR